MTIDGTKMVRENETLMETAATTRTVSSHGCSCTLRLYSLFRISATDDAKHRRNETEFEYVTHQ